MAVIVLIRAVTRFSKAWPGVEKQGGQKRETNGMGNGAEAFHARSSLAG
nr:hypothetical protein [uncultured Ottowia sp.]